MAQPPQRPWLRVIVPVALVLVVGVGVFWAVVRNTTAQRPAQAAPTQSGAQQSPATTAAPTTADPQPVQAATQPDPAAPPPGGAPPVAAPAPTLAAAPASFTGLRARVVTDAPATFAPLGGLERSGPTALLEFSPYGAGVRRMTLARYFNDFRRKPDNHVVLQTERDTWFGPADDRQRRVFTPLGAVQVEVEGQAVNLTGRVKEPGKDPADAPVWTQAGPGSFECIVEDESGEAVLRIVRVYELPSDLHCIRLRQHVENLAGRPLKVKWLQFGPVDMGPASATAGQSTMKRAYGGDQRRVRFGYLAGRAVDPGRQEVLTAAYETLGRAALVGAYANGAYQTLETAWPRPRSRSEHELVWFGMTDRYFAVALYPLIQPKSNAPGLPGPDKVFRLAAAVYRALLNPWVSEPTDLTMALQMGSPALTVDPGKKADLSIGVYAGPLLASEPRKDPAMNALGLDGLVVYNFGGWCGWCTFAWLAHLLLGLLRVLHDWLLFDWALSIICLVVVVRTLLHPVTRWSQIRMARFGKQIGDLAPKQKKMQEKYKDDPKKLREEIGRLYREEGINPLGMLGCLPAFLQTPVWIALYAMLGFAFELRQEPAFFGVFQAISGGRWPFLADLAEADCFIPFGTDINIPFLSALMGSVSGLNILPLILGVVFYVQQKYLTPPTSATLTPEQEQTQRIMKVMMVVMFPLFMYNAPSGLAIYFITNSSLGIAESKWIRAHMTRHDLLSPQKKPAKPGGFLKRLQAVMEERQKRLMQTRGTQARRKS